MERTFSLVAGPSTRHCHIGSLDPVQSFALCWRAGPLGKSCVLRGLQAAGGGVSDPCLISLSNLWELGGVTVSEILIGTKSLNSAHLRLGLAFLSPHGMAAQRKHASVMPFLTRVCLKFVIQLSKLPNREF